ncbi:hypothetical protein NJC40_20935 [Pseudomonas sp. 21LCFQ02]|uniref:hypothetical protein n=1 Tax=unclassified Pseudomonas TaxID=196821 RepID=UPI0005EF3FB6|nr:MULTISPECIES: hypothetical protein [unclassified Pseudomonas]MCO8162828.1 hypothetical protein [Pseudomonas sp. 21LCFQ010]MCO8170233.1 hypothetical protein [Pseudomonas sp. 21LCFQ02]
MLIQIEEGISASEWIVKLDDYPVICRSRQEADEFAERMQTRLAAPHPLPGPPRPAADESLSPTAH